MLRQDFFTEGDRPADLVVVLAVRRAPIVTSSDNSDLGWQVAKFMADYSGVCQAPSQIPEDIFEAIKANLEVKPEQSVQEVAQGAIDFASQNAPKIKSLIDNFRGLFGGSTKKEPAP